MLSRHPTSTTLPNLRRAKDLADQRFDQSLDLDDLAAAAGFSKFHFNRAFTKAYGETPMRYVTRRRIERAQDLLRSANLSVTEISILVGYNSLGSFTSRFTALVGASPTEYRRTHREVGARHIPGCFLFLRGVDPAAPACEPATVQPIR
ncbi:MAG: helix-turn-helix transcriptional regulator [Actinomycetota bacterium]